MKICQVIPNLLIGGGERVVVDLSKDLKRRGDDVLVVSLYEGHGTHLEQELRASGVSVEFLGKRRGPDPRMLFRIRRVISQFRPDVIHTHLYTLRYVWPAIAGTKGAVRMHTVHSVAEREVTPLGSVVQRLAFVFGRVQAVAISEEVARTVERRYGIKPTVIMNGIDTEKFVPMSADARAAWRREHGLEQDAVLFVSVARLSPEKNIAGVLEAFSSLVPRCPRARLLVVGDGPLRDELDAGARRLGCWQQCKFLGRRSDVERIVGASDASVMFSLYEGGPLSVVEAMACGMPVIASDVGAVRDMISDGSSGIVIPKNDRDALRRAMEALYNDQLGRSRIGSAARARALRALSVTAMGGAYRDLYARRIDRSVH